MENLPNCKSVQFDGGLALKLPIGRAADAVMKVLGSQCIVLFSINKKGFEMSISSYDGPSAKFIDDLSASMNEAMQVFLATRTEKG